MGEFFLADALSAKRTGIGGEGCGALRAQRGGESAYKASMTALPLTEILLLLAALVAAGLAGGLIAGLFGVGGGTVIVPALFYAFEVLGVGGESNLHVAIGTSLLTIVATSWRSLKAHRAHGAVDEVVLKTWTPWVAAGRADRGGGGGLDLDGGAGHRLWRLSGC